MRAVAARFGDGAASLATLLVFVLLIGLPLSLVLVQSVIPALFDPVAPSIGFDANSILRTFGDPRLLRSIGNSVMLASIVSITATALGALYAIAIHRTNVAGRKVLAGLPWLVFLAPGYLKALAWTLLMSPGGYFTQLGILPAGVGNAFFGPGGLVFLHSFNLWPLPSFIIGGALAGLGSEYEDAARLSGVRLSRCWTHINLPLLAPAFALCVIAVYAEVLSDFGLASTIARVSDFGLITYGIYAAASTYPVDFAMAGSQALVLLLMVALLVLADRLLRRQAIARLISGRARPIRIYSLGIWRWPLALVLWLVGIIALVLPITTIAVRAFLRTLGGGLEASNFTMRFVTQALTYNNDINQALIRSLGYALSTAAICTSIGLILALRLDGASRNVKAGVMALALGTVAIPGIVLGFGYILVWNRLPGFRDLPVPHYGSASLLVMGYVGAALPYCLVIILTAIGQLAPSLTEAARLSGAGWWRRTTRIVLPLIALSAITAFLFTFIRSVFELPMSQLLVPLTGPAAPTLIVHLFGRDDDGLGSAMSLVAMVTVALAASLIWQLARRFNSRASPVTPAAAPAPLEPPAQTAGAAA